MIPNLSGQGFFAPLSEAIKKVVTIPVILTGGITDVQAAEQLLTEEKADLIGVGRAILNNSKWPKQAIIKIEEIENARLLSKASSPADPIR